VNLDLAVQVIHSDGREEIIGDLPAAADDLGPNPFEEVD
jgi:hypothetical protein